MRSAVFAAVAAAIAVRSVVFGCQATLDLPDDLNLDVHIFTDPEHTKNFTSEEEARTYILKFWNSVVLRFARADSRIHLTLANITFLNDSSYEPKCFDYLENNTPNRKVFKHHKFVNLNTSMTKLEKCLKEKDLESTADMIYVITGYEPRIIDKKGNWKPSPGAAAKRGGVCTQDNYALGWDIPRTYFGVRTMIRLLAYLMGSEFARRRQVEKRECRLRDGFLMSEQETGLNSNRFSPCSLTEMEAVLKNLTEQCKNSSFTDLTDKGAGFPGDNMSHDQHCETIRKGFYSCGSYSHGYGCETVCCLPRVSGTSAVVASWDGESCGDGECYNGDCVYSSYRPK